MQFPDPHGVEATDVRDSVVVAPHSHCVVLRDGQMYPINFMMVEIARVICRGEVGEIP